MSEQTTVASPDVEGAPATAAGRRLLAFLPNEQAGWHGLPAAILAIESEARAAALAEGRALREAVLSGPPVRFPKLPTQPTGPDVLDAIAAWMDKIDARDGNPHHEVQDHLRSWAVRLRAALDRVGTPQ